MKNTGLKEKHTQRPKLHRPLFALADCNNFYASCERVFNPKLRDRPVVILSSNDGCIVARSNEAKSLGIPMGVPVFKIRHEIARHRIAVCSSNYTLYADMSNRIMKTLRLFTPHIEIYSIDEAFLRLDSLTERDLRRYASKMRDTVMRWTGVPVSIGIAPTKTLAKLAGLLAKRDPLGVYSAAESLMHANTSGPETSSSFLNEIKKIPVSKIWGIGRRLAVTLNMQGIYTVYDYMHADPKWIRRKLTITGWRTFMELHGTSCLSLQELTLPRQSIISSQSFGEPIDSFIPLKEALALYTARAARKLREQHSTASLMQIYITTKPFGSAPRYANSAIGTIDPPSSYTPALISRASTLLESIYRSGFRYKKAGIFLTGIHPEGMQMRLFDRYDVRERQIMQAVDVLNRKWGRGIVRSAAEGTLQRWHMKQSSVSSRFTTSWDELLHIVL